MNKEEIVSITKNQNGDWYVIYKVPKVVRGIRGKTKALVDEVLIVGIPKSKFAAWCKQQDIVVVEEKEK